MRAEKTSIISPHTNCFSSQKQLHHNRRLFICQNQSERVLHDRYVFCALPCIADGRKLRNRYVFYAPRSTADAPQIARSLVFCALQRVTECRKLRDRDVLCTFRCLDTVHKLCHRFVLCAFRCTSDDRKSRDRHHSRKVFDITNFLNHGLCHLPGKDIDYE